MVESMNSKIKRVIDSKLPVIEKLEKLVVQPAYEKSNSWKNSVSTTRQADLVALRQVYGSHILDYLLLLLTYHAMGLVSAIEKVCCVKFAEIRHGLSRKKNQCKTSFEQSGIHLIHDPV
jgi:hypothetical protein